MSTAVFDFLHGARYESLPPDALAQGRRLLLDLLGVAAGGIRTELSRIIRDHAAEQFGPGRRRARMLLDGRCVSPAGAALAGGMSIDALDAHDGHKLTKGHVGCGLAPALFAMSEAEGRLDDRELLAALVVGYEIGSRAGMALHRTASDYHTSGAWIAVTAAAVGARVLGLDGARTREAVGIAEYHGPRSQMMRCIDHPTMLKDGSGWGAMAGVSAACLAADGFTGAPALTVEGDDVADLWADLGSRWRIAEQYFKPWPVCRWAQPVVQAVLDLRAEHGLRSEDVSGIAVETFHESIRLAVREPRTTEQAQYSTAYPAAAALVRGGLGLGEVEAAAFADPEIRRLAASMRFSESAEFNAAFPARRFARVTLLLGDGRELVSPATEASGDPENPASMQAVRAKYRACAVPALGRARAEAIETAVDRLGEGEGAATLLDLVCAPLPPSEAVQAVA